jgi:hypothetical protein
MLQSYALLADRHSLARFRVRATAVRAERDTECRTTISVRGRVNDAGVEPQPASGLVTSAPFTGCERHTNPSSEHRVRGRGRRRNRLDIRR